MFGLILFSIRYLYEFLYGWLVSALTRADTFLIEQELIMEVQKTKGTNKKKSKYKKKTRPYNRDILYFQALQNMCGGYYKVSWSRGICVNTFILFSVFFLP